MPADAQSWQGWEHGSSHPWSSGSWDSWHESESQAWGSGQAWHEAKAASDWDGGDDEIAEPWYIDAHDLVLEPPSGSHCFTMVLLHSCSGGPDDWLPIVHRLDLPFRGKIRFVIPCAPVRHENHGSWSGKMNSWFEYSSDGLEAKDPTQVVEQREHFLKLLQRELRLLPGQEPRRLVLGGLSQGVALAAEVALAADSVIGGLVCLRGSLLASSTKGAVRAGGKGLEVFAYHGERDRQCPVEEARQSYQQLQRHGAVLRFVADPALGHSCARGRQQLCGPELAEVSRFLQRIWGSI